MLTVETLRTEYNFTFSDDDLAFWQNVLNSAKDAVFKYIGLTASGYISATHYFSDLDREFFIIPYAPIIKIDSISKGTYDDLVNGTGTPVTKYIVDNASGIITVYDESIKTFEDNENLRVDYKAGYTDDTLPKALEVAIVYTARNIAKLLQTETLGVGALSSDSVEIQTQDYIPFAIYTILKKYMIWRIL